MLKSEVISPIIVPQNPATTSPTPEIATPPQFQPKAQGPFASENNSSAAAQFDAWQEWRRKDAELTHLVELADEGRHWFNEGEAEALAREVAEAKARWVALAQGVQS